MMKFAFISRHTPTIEQIELAKIEDIELEHIGDCDAFTVSPGFVDHSGAFDGVIVVHPAAALRLCGSFIVGVFENGQRPAEGSKMTFQAKELHLFNLVE